MAEMKYYTVRAYADALEREGMLKSCNLRGKEGQVITGLTYDSREAKEGTLFVCKGAAFKEQYLLQAIGRGADAYVSEQEYEKTENTPCILVKDIRKAMPLLANIFYCRPWEDLTVVGVGGTKGKSTSAYYMKAIVDDYLASQDKKESAVISGIDIYDGVTTVESHITTPEAIALQQHFRNARSSGIEFVEMEVSSQALKYDRVEGMRFDASIFLNISEDHISPIEHTDFEDYFAAKMKMFRLSDIAAVNLDSEHSGRALQHAKDAGRMVTFSMEDPSADFYAHNIRKEGNGTKFFVKTEDFDEEFALTMPGLFNVENAMGVIAAAVELGIPRRFIRSGLYRARSKGRMEMFASKDQRILAIVDYAHNKLSFEKLFSSMKKEYPDYDIVAVFGCPGKKALTRRRDLGTVAGKYSKKVYLTAEDPGMEPVENISRDIARYVKAQNCQCEMIENRGEAIKAAMSPTKSKKLLLITGKGKETRQKYGNEYLDCRSDVDYVEEYLADYDSKTSQNA